MAHKIAVFDIYPIERFAGKSQPLKRPKEITCFSYDKNREWHWDSRSMQYYWPADCPADLSEGHDKFVRWDDSTDEHLDGLLKAIMALEEQNEERLKTHIVTWRGMITKIMSAPYDRYNSFDMKATFFQDTIFIEENHSVQHAKKQTQNSRRPNYPGGPSQDLMSFWGYKYESLALIPDIWANTTRDFIENRPKEIVNNIEQYCSVVQTGIGSTSLIIGGEVDGVWDVKPEDKEAPINWVELKTSEIMQSEQDLLKFEKKLLKFWIQSFLIGVPKIIVGFRSKDGILVREQEMPTQSIPKAVKNHSASWDGNTCVNFTASFLEFARATITSEGVWRIRRLDKSPIIEIFKEDEAGTGGILLPDFVTWRQRIFATEVAHMLG